jgi:hypothetical protein
MCSPLGEFKRRQNIANVRRDSILFLDNLWRGTREEIKALDGTTFSTFLVKTFVAGVAGQDTRWLLVADKDALLLPYNQQFEGSQADALLRRVGR